MDNPHYQYDYGPGVDDEVYPDEGTSEDHHGDPSYDEPGEYDPAPRSDE
jgi:hypothetical protein